MSEGGQEISTGHSVTHFATRLRTRLDELVEAPTWSMTKDDKQQALRDLAVAAAQLESLRLRVLVDAERDGDVIEPSDRSVADWVARETRQTRASARADLKHALALDQHHRVLATAHASGIVNSQQARAITRSLDLLPRQGRFATTTEERETAEAHLVELAATFDARALETLGKRVYAVICPEVADAYEGTLLQAEEARAARTVLHDTWDDSSGTTHGRFRVPRLHGHMLRKALAALTDPTRVSTGAADERPLPVRRGEALCELLERIATKDLPAAGGGATVVVTMTMDALVARLDEAGVATLDTGLRVSASEARRLACRHHLVPAVLGSKSVVLDLGTESRLFSAAQRRALAAAQGGCTAEHCDVPAAMCHAHHDVPWSRGGRTDLANGRLLCGPHHRRVHDAAYEHELTPDNQVRFHRRT